VIDGATGVLAAASTADAFADALNRVRQLSFDATAIRDHALRFSRERFMTDFRQTVDDALAAARWPQGGNSATREANQ
jgi:hypothetical protein